MGDESCVRCGVCTENCLFLKKYEMDIGELLKHPEYAYHCFLCGRCTQSCPIGIDGRGLVLNMRQEQVRTNGGRLLQPGYRMLLWEKKNYRFANYRRADSRCVIFPGCNFPSFYPKTTRLLSGLLKERAGIGTVFDCCGKPLAELGLTQQESVSALEKRLSERGVEQLVMLCPNCYHFLKPKLKISVVSIYEKLAELGLGKRISESLCFFLPCPDRENREILGHIRGFLIDEPMVWNQLQCCGLGGCVGGREPELSRQMGRSAAELREESFGELMTYCASCTGQFVRNGCLNTGHILLKILDIREIPQIKRSVFNRMKMKYWSG